MGIDDTIERRRGKRIAAKGIYRDPVRSSDSHFVKCSGLRWLSLMLLVEVPWAQRVWALPFLSVLALSERYHQLHHQRHKKLIDWARQMLTQVRRWLPERAIVLVADSSFAALELLEALRQLPNPGSCGDAVASGCCALHPCPSASSQADGTSSQSWSTTANAQHPVRGGANHLAVVAAGGMVWGTLLPAGDCLTNSSLVSHWITCGADSLGTGQRPRRQVGTAGISLDELGGNT